MREIATFGAGCFWGVESAFRQVPGVLTTEVGYAGGHTEHPTYEQVCSHATGHAEVVQVTFDPDKASYDQLLEVFWATHDPTTLNRQGPDVGDQYRSAIYVHSDDQEIAATKSKAHAQAAFAKPIVTEITPAPAFWAAEEYHQQYFERRGLAPTCHLPG